MTIEGRVEYDGEGLSEDAVGQAPLDLIAAWVQEAKERHAERGDVPEPTALSVATVDEQGQPDVRTVLMRFLRPRGIAFLTHTGSAKGVQIAGNARVAASLTWPAMFRSIRFQGTAAPVSRSDVHDYFVQRPWASRISAWASEQSRPTDSRESLESAYRAYAERYPDRGGQDDVPVPPEWGGYWVEPHRVELWAGRRNRLHDRFVYELREPGDLAQGRAWARHRLQP